MFKKELAETSNRDGSQHGFSEKPWKATPTPTYTPYFTPTCYVGAVFHRTPQEGIQEDRTPSSPRHGGRQNEMVPTKVEAPRHPKIATTPADIRTWVGPLFEHQGSTVLIDGGSPSTPAKT